MVASRFQFRRPLALVALWMSVAMPAIAAPKKATEPAAPPTPIVVGDWTGLGEGKTVSKPDGFAQEGKTPLNITNEKLTGAYLLTGEILLPAPGAALRIGFDKDAFSTAKKAKPPADAPASTGPAPLAGLAFVAGKDGKSLAFGRNSIASETLTTDRLPLLVVVGRKTVEVFFGGFESIRPRVDNQPIDLGFSLSGGAQLQNLKVIELPKSDLMPIVVAAQRVNVAVSGNQATVAKIDAASLPSGLKEVDGVPFYFATGDLNALDVATSMADVKEPFRNKSFFFGPSGNKLGRVAMSVPGDQYSALHVIAFSAGRKDHVPHMTVRMGRYGGSSAVLEDAVVEVPTLATSAAKGAIPVKLAGGKSGYLHHIRIPFAQTGNIKEMSNYDLEFTRDINTHVMPPDPNEFGAIPAGMPSDVVVLAATLEPSPVTMTYETAEPGNVFSDKQKAAFKVSLTNRSNKLAQVRAYAAAAGPGTGEELGIDRKSWNVEQKIRLKPAASEVVTLDVTPQKRGWFTCTIGVEADGDIVQLRDTTFAVLAPDTRKAFTDSPFGVWEFWHPHSSFKGPGQVEKLASLMNKGGWRWTYGGSPGASATEDSEAVIKRMRDQYKIMWNAKSLYQGYQRGEGWYNEVEFQEKVVDDLQHSLGVYDPHFKVMHESRSSLDLLRRYSEFLGGKEYNMPQAEKEKLEKQFENVKDYCLAIKKADPRAKVVLFNDYPSVVFQFLRRGIPAEAFDAIGLEGAMFIRQPERQPDWLSLLGHMHEMKRALAKFGYSKPVWTTEALYHPTERGALSLHSQGVIAIREAMMALQLGVSRMAAAGIIKDPSDDYHWSNWGSAGYCFRDPEINPKPSYAMYAWLTQVLDQAKPNGKIASPNFALHVVDFKKADGSHVYAVWTANGVQTVTLKTTGKPQLHDVFGNPIETKAGNLTINASHTPHYVVGGTIESVASATPVEVPDEIGKELVDFDNPKLLEEVATINPILESNWDTPRLKGSFDTSYATEDGASAIRIALKRDSDERTLLPRYVEYQLAKPITLPGRPYQFTARVKGNAGWARILFELVDAKGRVWTSSGNQYAGASNAQDPHGESFVSFLGWQTMKMPIVGMYPGKDQALYWPKNYNWWRTNSPEEVELAQQANEFAAQYQADLKTYETAKKQYEADLAKWTEEKAAADKAGKKITAAPKPPVEPKQKGVRNMGYAVVDYPLKLTKVIVTMRPNILYLDEEKPVDNQVIFIDKLGVLDPPTGM